MTSPPWLYQDVCHSRTLRHDGLRCRRPQTQGAMEPDTGTASDMSRSVCPSNRLALPPQATTKQTAVHHGAIRQRERGESGGDREYRAGEEMRKGDGLRWSASRSLEGPASRSSTSASGSPAIGSAHLAHRACRAATLAGG